MYPLIHIPPEFRGPSCEEGQILLDGIVNKVSLSHGRVDDEADWHVYIDLDEPIQSRLQNHFDYLNIKSKNGFAEIYCELMVLNRYDKGFFDDKFYSADVTLPFRLSKQGVAHPGIEMGEIITNNQGGGKTVGGSTLGGSSRLVTDRGRAYLQGAFVFDKAHGDLVEIHPLDSIAFAMDKNGRTISAKPGEAGWPTEHVHWRVAYFANSKLHRINDEAYLKHPRTITWLLDLPSKHSVSPSDDGFGGGLDVFANFSNEVVQLDFWNPPSNNAIFSQGDISTPEQAKYVRDPKDGRVKYKVSQRMEPPDNLGSMLIIDYIMEVKPQVFA